MLHVTPKLRHGGETKHYVYNSKVYDTSNTPKHNDLKTSYRTLYRYLQTNGYVTYEGRGQSSRWARVNAKISTNVIHDLVVIDIAKLWTMRSLTNRHANTMRKFAHKIKVNALKSTRRTGDKQI